MQHADDLRRERGTEAHAIAWWKDCCCNAARSAMSRVAVSSAFARAAFKIQGPQVEFGSVRLILVIY
jgi:hypothetical protein